MSRHQRKAGGQDHHTLSRPAPGGLQAGWGGSVAGMLRGVTGEERDKLAGMVRDGEMKVRSGE